MTKERKQKLLASMTATIFAGVVSGTTTRTIPSDSSLVPDSFKKAQEILDMVEKNTK